MTTPARRPRHKVHAVRLGPAPRLGLEFVQSIRSTQDQWFYLFTAVLDARLPLDPPRRRDRGHRTCRSPSVALPSILGALIAFGVVIGPAYALAMEREDGTLLRHRAIPDGLVGYFSGQMLFHSLSLVPQLS